MPACGRCGHDNADHLRFCCSCGRRLRGSDGPISPSGGQQTRAPESLRDRSPIAGIQGISTGFAPTIVLSGATPGSLDGEPTVGGRGSGSRFPVSLIATAWDALRYVFVYIRGRVDAEGRKRDWIQEREGAHRLVEGVLFGLGQSVIAEGLTDPQVAHLIQAVGKALARRDVASADLAAAEKLRVSDDLRLGIEESNAQHDWRACDAGAAELDILLRKIEDERHDVDAEIHRLRPPTQAPNDLGRDFGRDLDRETLEQKRALLEQQYASMRERAAALRATTIAARAKLDQTIAARRQAAAAMTAGLTAHAGDRGAADQQIRQLTGQIGRAAAQARLPLTGLLPGYAHVARLDAIIAERDRLIAGAQGTLSRADRRKLALGTGILLIVLATIGIGLRTSLR